MVLHKMQRVLVVVVLLLRSHGVGHLILVQLDQNLLLRSSLFF